MGICGYGAHVNGVATLLITSYNWWGLILWELTYPPVSKGLVLFPKVGYVSFLDGSFFLRNMRMGRG